MRLRNSVRFLLQFYQFLGIFLIMMVVLSIEHFNIRKSIYNEVESKGSNIIKLLEVFISQNPTQFNKETLNPLLLQFGASVSGISRIMIIDHANNIIADTNPSIANPRFNSFDFHIVSEDPFEKDIQYSDVDGKRTMYFVRPLRGSYDPQRRTNEIGFIFVSLSLDQTNRIIWGSVFQITLYLLSVFALIYLVLNYLIRSKFITPLSEITDVTRLFGSGKFSIRAKGMEIEELNEVALTFNRMADEVEQMTNRLKTEMSQNEQQALSIHEANEKLKHFVQELEQRNKESMLLSEMGNLLQTSSTYEESNRIISSFCQQLFPGLSGKLFIFSSSKNDLQESATWGMFSKNQSEDIIYPDQCWALRRGQIHIGGETLDSLLCHHIKISENSGKYICVPMMAHGETLGVLHLHFSEEMQEGFSGIKQLSIMVAEHISLSLANLKLREMLRNQSIRDVLSGLYNRRYFEETFEREIIRADRHNRNLSIVMIDLDHFKKFNDVHGHQAGDLVLREIGSIFKSWVRAGDIACRYGGEEFVLLLPEICLEATLRRVEELRITVEKMKIKYHSQQLDSLTISLGVAVYPTHGLTMEELLRRADLALYQAKSKGRNCIELARVEGADR